MPSDDRDLAWDGCFNVRDLGGLPVAGGGRIRRGALVRADALSDLTADGWQALVAHGVRTVVDLRDAGERGPDRAARPASVTTVELPLDGSDDRAFWSVWRSGPQFATPRYWGPHLERMPGRSAAVLRAIIAAPPGGVAVHCAAGRDRTGQITALALALAGVPAEHIAADHARSTERLAARCAARGDLDDGPLIARHLAEQGTSAEELVTAFTRRDLAADLGLSEAEVEALRARLIA